MRYSHASIVVLGVRYDTSKPRRAFPRTSLTLSTQGATGQSSGFGKDIGSAQRQPKQPPFPWVAAVTMPVMTRRAIALRLQ